MEEDKKLERRKNIEIVVLSIIIVALLGALIYLLFIKRDEKTADNNVSNNQQQQNNDQIQQNNSDNENQVNTKYKAVDFDEMINSLKKDDSNASYEITTDVLPRELDIKPMDNNYHVVLSNDGRVTIKKENGTSITISNISNAKNIDYCNDMYVRLFILLNNGDVYEYELDDFDNGKYTATKINEIKDATKFVKLSWSNCTECGGNINLGVIDKNNKYIELDSLGV